METIIRIRPSELNVNLLNKIKEFIGEKEDIDIVISLTETNNYNEALTQSIKSAEGESNLISFTMEDFMAYDPTTKSGE